ncbi:hypothetical protein B9479_007374 [Cryptococcus floricola]|uniref:Uncharacterized protein n=1 Tax=Cryptococcus floricola TaxID=2591691 RepID=A0A5D3APG3_9TREE|nr:hypothetical protein B9479_007374 [Cryptococcus floricola]
MSDEQQGQQPFSGGDFSSLSGAGGPYSDPMYDPSYPDWSQKSEEEKASKGKEKITTSTAQPDDIYDSRFPLFGGSPDFEHWQNEPPPSQAEYDAMFDEFEEGRGGVPDFDNWQNQPSPSEAEYDAMFAKFEEGRGGVPDFNDWQNMPSLSIEDLDAMSAEFTF